MKQCSYYHGRTMTCVCSCTSKYNFEYKNTRNKEKMSVNDSIFYKNGLKVCQPNSSMTNYEL